VKELLEGKVKDLGSDIWMYRTCKPRVHRGTGGGKGGTRRSFCGPGAASRRSLGGPRGQG